MLSLASARVCLYLCSTNPVIAPFVARAPYIWLMAPFSHDTHDNFKPQTTLHVAQIRNGSPGVGKEIGQDESQDGFEPTTLAVTMLSISAALPL